MAVADKTMVVDGQTYYPGPLKRNMMEARKRLYRYQKQVGFYQNLAALCLGALKWTEIKYLGSQRQKQIMKLQTKHMLTRIREE